MNRRQNAKALQLGAVILVALSSYQSLTACVSAAPARPATQSVEQATKPDLKLLLLDKRTRKPIMRTAVKIYSDNGIRCRTTPCPTNGLEWNGKTDGRGYVLIPSQIRQNSMAITAVGYSRGGDLTTDSMKRNKDYWVIALKPNKPVK
jgi:hypothetical protein